MKGLYPAYNGAPRDGRTMFAPTKLDFVQQTRKFGKPNLCFAKHRIAHPNTVLHKSRLIIVVFKAAEIHIGDGIRLHLTRRGEHRSPDTSNMRKTSHPTTHIPIQTILHSAFKSSLREQTSLLRKHRALRRRRSPPKS